MEDEILIEYMAKAGYERFYEGGNWHEVRMFKIEGDMWREVAREMLKEVKRHGGLTK